ncbi:TPA: hypothetical protein KOX39_003451 [Clostridioides difficile]|nr:hypothetical protein [Clostridioides difficile]
MDIKLDKKELDIDLGDIVTYKGTVCLVVEDANDEYYLLVALEGVNKYKVLASYEYLSDIDEDKANITFLISADDVELSEKKESSSYVW